MVVSLVSPTFWDTRCARSTALLPLSLLYAWGGRAVEALSRPPRRAPVPVICAGTALVGGANKTPVALAISERLACIRPSQRVHFLTRGYGGSTRGPLRVQTTHQSCLVGDEALLLARARPTWVAANRIEGAIAAHEAGADLVIMDDGLQHHAMKRDVSLLCLDSHYLLGNGRVLPAGPLRESFSAALARSDAVVAVTPCATQRRPGGTVHTEGSAGCAPSGCALRLALGLPASVPLIQASLEPEPHAAAALCGQRVLPFSGTARPSRFFETLRSIGCEVVDELPLPDHAPITAPIMDRLKTAAAAQNAVLATTVKDAARLSDADLHNVHILPMRIRWHPDALEQIDALLYPILGQLPREEMASMREL